MPVTGTMPLSHMQAAIEAVYGTILPATRKQPIMPGAFLKEHEERHYTDEQRGTYIDHYRSYVLKSHVEIAGVQVAATFEDVPWFLQAAAKGGVTGGAGDGGTPAMYTYTFVPTLSVNDLKSVNWEVADDTQNFSVAGCVANSLELGFSRQGAMSMSVSYVGQRAVAQALTGALSDRVVEDINGALWVAYIDTNTIGSTLYAYPLSLKFTLENGYQPLYVGDGNLFPKEFFRGAKRHMKLEATLAFDSVAERNAFKAGTERKIRLRCDGSTIHTTVKKRIDIDWYGPWAEATFGEEGGLKTLTLSAESQLNAGAGHDWRIVVQNALNALP
jgi:hypothetical protein